DIVAGGSIFGAFITSFLMHERVGVFLHFLADLGMLLQVHLQVRMALHELLVVYKGRVLAELFGSFTMTIEKLIEVGQFPASCVPIATIFLPIETILFPHERFRTFLYF